MGFSNWEYFVVDKVNDVDFVYHNITNTLVTDYNDLSVIMIYDFADQFNLILGQVLFYQFQKST